MKVALKIIIECVFCKIDKVEKLTKLDSFRKNSSFEFGTHHDINNISLEYVDDISFKLIDKTNYDGNDSVTIWENSENQNDEIFDKFNE